MAPSMEMTRGVRSASTSASDPESLSASEGESLSTVRKNTTSDLGAEYPVDLLVRNTFLDFPVGRPESLEDFLQYRMVRSAPGSKVEHRSAPGSKVEDTDDGASGDVVPCVEVGGMQRVDQDFAPSACAPVVLRLASVLGDQRVDGQRERQAQLGSPALPTQGSAGHHLRRCKPCAFFWKAEGCGNGVGCEFCHLCEEGEKKRRQTDKKENIRARRSSVTSSGNFQRAVTSRLNRFFS